MVEASEFFRMNNPLFMDACVAIVLYIVYRLLAKRFPRISEGIKEASLMFLVFMCYDASRYFALNSEAVAKHNAELVIGFENVTHMDIEIPLQKIIVKHEEFAKFLNSFYLGAHWGGLVIFFVWAYARVLFAPASKQERRRSEYVTARGRFIVMNILAAISFIAFPCAPPRQMPGYIDTLSAISGADVYSSTRRFVNPYAAMPSMHQGYSLLFALTICMMLRSEIFASATEPDDSDDETTPAKTDFDDADTNTAALRAYVNQIARRYRAYRMLSPETRRSPTKLQLIALLPIAVLAYPLFMFVVIVGTGNHFVLDAIAGACACGLACAFLPFITCALAWFNRRVLARAYAHLTQFSVRLMGEKGVDIELGEKVSGEEKKGFLAAETA